MTQIVYGCSKIGLVSGLPVYAKQLDTPLLNNVYSADDHKFVNDNIFGIAYRQLK